RSSGPSHLFPPWFALHHYASPPVCYRLVLRHDSLLGPLWSGAAQWPARDGRATRGDRGGGRPTCPAPPVRVRGTRLLCHWRDCSGPAVVVSGRKRGVDANGDPLEPGWWGCGGNWRPG